MATAAQLQLIAEELFKSSSKKKIATAALKAGVSKRKTVDLLVTYAADEQDLARQRVQQISRDSELVMPGVSKGPPRVDKAKQKEELRAALEPILFQTN